MLPGSKVSAADKVFREEADLRSFLKEPETGECYIIHHLLPFLEMYGIEGCIEILNNPGQKIVEATLLDVVHRAAATAKAAERFPHLGRKTCCRLML